MTLTKWIWKAAKLIPIMGITAIGLLTLYNGATLPGVVGISYLSVYGLVSFWTLYSSLDL